MSLPVFRHNRRALENFSKYGPSPRPEKRPLSNFWRVMPFFVVKWKARRSCARKQIGHLVFVEAFEGTHISIGRAGEV